MFNLEFNTNNFVELLSKFIEHSYQLQNSDKHTPQESLIANLVQTELQEHIDSGKITYRKFEYVENRPNIMLEYNLCTSDERTICFGGSHFDVVPANPTEWKYDPFKLTVENDNLYGRGTTDCLGHVALITLLIKNLAERNIVLNYKFVVLFIADEEYGADENVGVLHVYKEGHLDFLKKGPFYWVDASDVVPVLACGTGFAWKLRVTGKKTHTGFPLNGVNPLPIAFELSKMIIQKFGELCPKSEKDDEYKFSTHSNMKPTLISCPESGITQYYDYCEIFGDVRMTPFTDPYKLKIQLSEYVNSIDLNTISTVMETEYHPCFVTTASDGTQCTYKFEWIKEPYCGIAVDTNSDGFVNLMKATTHHHDNCHFKSDLGAIPLVGQMQNAGFDIQMVGYGIGSVYHGNDEYCTISGMKKGYEILGMLLELSN